MVILKRILGGKFSVFVTNPDNVCFKYSELEALYFLPMNSYDLTYKEAERLRNELNTPLKRLGLKAVIK